MNSLFYGFIAVFILQEIEKLIMHPTFSLMVTINKDFGLVNIQLPGQFHGFIIIDNNSTEASFQLMDGFNDVHDV